MLARKMCALKRDASSPSACMTHPISRHASILGVLAPVGTGDGGMSSATIAAPSHVARLVALWYGASVIAVASAKTILIAAPCPAILCTMQFGIAVVGARRLQRSQPVDVPCSARERRLVLGVAASYAVGPTETRKERSREREEVSEVSLAPAPAPAARALLFGGECAETRKAKAEADAAEKARVAASEAAAAKERLERERARAAKAEAARLEIARLDALRLEEAARAMRREKALLEERREKERAANASRPPTHRPPVGETAAAKPAKSGETAAPETTARRQSGGLFGRPGIVVSSSVAERPSP